MTTFHFCFTIFLITFLSHQYPVDVTAGVLVSLLDPALSLPCGKIIAIADDDPVTFDEIGHIVSSVTPIKSSTYDRFRESLLSSPKNSLYPLLASFPPDGPHIGLRNGDRSEFDKTIQMKFCYANSTPRKSDLIVKYLEYLMKDEKQ